MSDANLPLQGLKVLDFSTLLPGPMASLMLAEAGADVIKFERPGEGDAMRAHEADFALLNRGKRSVAVDLKDPEALEQVLALLPDADVLIEQFRPGVMDRLGLGHEAVSAINPRLIYCSINGYGSQGARANAVGHDLNYVAEAGLLSLSTDDQGAPVMPHTLLADIGAGAYPAVINVLLALMQRERTGLGVRVEIAMADNTLPFLYPAHASAYGRGHWPAANDAVETGASPRYNLYRTRDGRYLAAAPVEEKFWQVFCDLIQLPDDMRAASRDAGAVRQAVASRIASRDAGEWEALFAGKDAACTVVRTFREAMACFREGPAKGDPRRVAFAGRSIDALPVPVVDALRRREPLLNAPMLGQHTGEMLR